MERKLVTIRQISSLDSIPGADAIEVASIDGWKVVVKRGEFQVGDLCFYFEIDSFLPESDPRYSFLMKSSVRTFEGIRGHKLRTIRLRGQISQGLALPLFTFPEIVDYNLDLDYSEILGIKKYEAPVAADLAGQVAGSFPSYIRKTDQERCQNLGNSIFGYEDTTFDFDVGKIPQESIDNMMLKGDLVKTDNGQYKKVLKAKADRDACYEITTKLDGSSMTAYVVPLFDGDNDNITMSPQIGVCSRNLQLKINEENKDNAFIKILNETNLGIALEQFFESTAGRSIAVQGELMGPGIQGNREQLKNLEFFIYDIFDIVTQEYVSPNERKVLIETLRSFSAEIKSVPILFENVTLQELNLNSVADLLVFAEGPSLVHPVREGVVFKRADGKFSFKSISNKFLEKEKD